MLELFDGERPTLDYNDPLAPKIDPREIAGRTLARRRRLRIGIGAAATLIVVIALSVVDQLKTAPTPAGRPDVFAALTAQPEYRAHPPEGQPTIVDASVPGWQSVVWYSEDHQLCIGTVGVGPKTDGQVAIGCATALLDSFAQDPVELPAFQALPTPWDNHDQALGIGITRPDVATIECTFRGVKVQAEAVPITVSGQVAFGAYAVWMPLHGATSYGTGDIEELVGLDDLGQPVR